MPGLDDDPDAAVVGRLLREQAPHLAQLPVRVSARQGSSNHVFRLGERLAVRLPRSDEYVPDLHAELVGLPLLRRHVGAAVPEVVVAGEPSRHFARPWAILTWLPGHPPRALDAMPQAELARTLGDFLRELHGIGTDEAPSSFVGRDYRCGEPVTDRIDAWLKRAADELADLVDPAATREAWRRLRQVPAASRPLTWVHTDLSTENLLVDDDGRLTGVIDLGGLGVGDRSVDLLYAWGLFDARARGLFRSHAGVDEASWLRARAWAFVGPGLLTIAGYRHTMPDRCACLCAMVERVASEVGVELR